MTQSMENYPQTRDILSWVTFDAATNGVIFSESKAYKRQVGGSLIAYRSHQTFTFESIIYRLTQAFARVAPWLQSDYQTGVAALKKSLDRRIRKSNSLLSAYGFANSEIMAINCWNRLYAMISEEAPRDSSDRLLPSAPEIPSSLDKRGPDDVWLGRFDGNWPKYEMPEAPNEHKEFLKKLFA